MSLLMLAMAAFVVVYAPPERPAAVFLIAVPSVVLALAVGGFATIKIKATLRGVELARQPEVNRGRPRASRKS
jgi:hypothetical protein